MAPGSRRAPPASPGNALNHHIGNKPLIDALLAAAGMDGAGGTLKDLVAPNAAYADADPELVEAHDVDDDETATPQG